MFHRLLPLMMLALASLPSSAGAGDWTQFRGPGGLGISDEKGIPVNWSSTENIAWKVDLPGPGSSCPIVVRDRVYLTCYTGYGLEPAKGDPAELRRLQTDRHLQSEIGPADGLASHQDAVTTIHANTRSQFLKRKLNGLDQVEALLKKADEEFIRKTPSRITDRTQPTLPQTGRNARCPCNSGRKYKQCCGR